jgi:hypothetical protein
MSIPESSRCLRNNYSQNGTWHGPTVLCSLFKELLAAPLESQVVLRRDSNKRLRMHRLNRAKKEIEILQCFRQRNIRAPGRPFAPLRKVKCKGQYNGPYQDNPHASPSNS